MRKRCTPKNPALLYLQGLEMFYRCLLVVACAWALSSADLELGKKYTNSQVLSTGNYTLYWNYTLDSTGNGNVSFAINVKTKGWAGLGISINGGMIHSDIGMGWATADGKPIFDVSNLGALSVTFCACM